MDLILSGGSTSADSDHHARVTAARSARDPNRPSRIVTQSLHGATEWTSQCCDFVGELVTCLEAPLSEARVDRRPAAG